MIAQNNDHVNPLIERESTTAVRHDAERGVWLSVNGQVQEHGSHQEAMLSALRTDYPDVAAQVESLAELSVPPTLPADIQEQVRAATLIRFLKAAQLLIGGHILSDSRVESQTEEGRMYRVSEIGMPKEWHCDCPDYAHRAPVTVYGGRMCKHVAAVLLAYYGEFPVRCGDCDGLGHFPGIPGIEGECTCRTGYDTIRRDTEIGHFHLADEDIPF
jgi:hypothetical protein